MTFLVDKDLVRTQTGSGSYESGVVFYKVIPTEKTFYENMSGAHPKNDAPNIIEATLVNMDKYITRKEKHRSATGVCYTRFRVRKIIGIIFQLRFIPCRLHDLYIEFHTQQNPNSQIKTRNIFSVPSSGYRVTCHINLSSSFISKQNKTDFKIAGDLS